MKASTWHAIQIERVGPGRWRLLAPVVYHVGGHPSPLGWTVEVPAGFECDLASVPWFARWLVDRDALAPAATVHDWLLMVRGVDRAIADGVFLEAARATPGTSNLTAALAYVGVAAYSLTR